MIVASAFIADGISWLNQCVPKIKLQKKSEKLQFNYVNSSIIFYSFDNFSAPSKWGRYDLNELKGTDG